MFKTKQAYIDCKSVSLYLRLRFRNKTFSFSLLKMECTYCTVVFSWLDNSCAAYNVQCMPIIHTCITITVVVPVCKYSDYYFLCCFRKVLEDLFIFCLSITLDLLYYEFREPTFISNRTQNKPCKNNEIIHLYLCSDR